MNWERDMWGTRLLLLGVVVSAAIVYQAGLYIWEALQ